MLGLPLKAQHAECAEAILTLLLPPQRAPAICTGAAGGKVFGIPSPSDGDIIIKAAAAAGAGIAAATAAGGGWLLAFKRHLCQQLPVL